VDKDIKLVASGASYYGRGTNNAWIDWNDYVLEHMIGKIDYLSVHRYVREVLGGETNFPAVMSRALDIDEKIEIVKALIKKAAAKSGSTRPVYISFDEWSARGPGGGNTLTEALMVAQHLNSFIRHADVVKMANITMLSSLVGNSPEGDFKNALYQAFYLYSNNSRGTALDVYADCERYSNRAFKDIPYLDVTAVLSDSGKTVVLNVVNRHEKNALTTDVVLQSGACSGSATVKEINAEIVDSSNSRTREGVAISSKDIQFPGNAVGYSFPAHSFTQMLISIK
jgi:alpha-N-arabinofuranosidase